MNKLDEYINLYNINIGKAPKNIKGIGEFYFLKKEIKLNRFKKKFLLLSHELGRTGAPIVLLELAKILKQKGHFVLIISLEKGELSKNIVAEEIPLIVMDNLKTMQFDADSSKKELELDNIIHSFDLSIFNTLVLYNFIIRYNNTNNKIIWWIHEGTTIIDIPWLFKMLPRNVGRNIRVCCVSDYSRKLLIDRGINFNASIFPYGIREVKQQKYESRITRDNNRIKICSVGTLCDRKNQKLLIDAIKNLPPSINDKCEYYFVGSVDPKDEYSKSILNEIIELTANNDFIFYKESLSREKMLQFFSEIDALIVPSKDDPLPVVATECLMLKKIVAVSNNTGISSYITNGENGFIFDSSNCQYLMETISFLVNNYEKINHIADNGYLIYKKYLSNKIFNKEISKRLKSFK